MASTTTIETKKQELPYEAISKYKVIDILKVRHIIPDHSRPYMWTRDKHIVLVSNDMIDSFENGRLYWFGVIIIYNGGHIPAISDAQHRLTICFLFIVILAELTNNDKPLSWISKYGCDDDVLDTIPSPEDRTIMDQYEWTRFPNIASCYEKDLEALGNILNGKDIRIHESSRIYAAYDTIKEIIQTRIKPNMYKPLLRFIHEDIYSIKINISDWDFTLHVFHSFNNIKVDVPPSFIIKNAITTLVGKESSTAIHNIFEKLSKDNIELTVHNIINLYKKHVYRSTEYKIQVDTFAKTNPDFTLSKFSSVVEQYESAKKLINENPYGRILLKYCISGHEVMSFCLIPVAFKVIQTKERALFTSMIRKLIAFSIRQGKSISFNSLKFQVPIIPKINEFLNDKISLETLVSFIGTTLANLLDEDCKNNAKFIESLCQEKYESNGAFGRARAMFLYIVESTDSHESIINHDNIDIDHIYPRKAGTDIAPLINPELIHVIGNFTPFASRNTEDILTGNKGLGRKPFITRVPHYKKSNIAITRELGHKYELTGFADDQIKERSITIATEISRLTAADLAIV